MQAGEDKTFRRGNLLNGINDKVTTRQVVNVLGRWKGHADWNEGIGRKGKLDEFRSGDYYDDDVKQLETDFSQPMEHYIARRPQFINFCARYGLVARWVHNENVAKLPFADSALAASIGATVEELNAEPIDPVAAEIVFDALAGSAAGFVTEAECNRLRASFADAEGGFDPEAFGDALVDTRKNLLGVWTFGPGLAVVTLCAVVYHWLPTILANGEAFRSKVGSSIAEDGPATLILPGALFAFVAFASTYETSSRRDGASTAAPRSGSVPSSMFELGPNYDGNTGRKLNYKEEAVRKQDELFIERMKKKKSGELDDDDELIQEILVNLNGDDWQKETEAYYAKQWEGLKRALPWTGTSNKQAAADEASSRKDGPTD